MSLRDKIAAASLKLVEEIDFELRNNPSAAPQWIAERVKLIMDQVRQNAR